MKIGIFGDSFCDGTVLPEKTPWYQILEDYGHTVTTYGACASSILYSANLLQQYQHEYEFIIWGVSSPNRISFPNSEGVQVHVHWPNFVFSKNNKFDSLTSKKIDIVKDWAKYIQDYEQEVMVTDSLARHFLTKYPNLMLVPCFEDPLREEFSLNKIVTKENDYFFHKNYDLGEIYKKYLDKRVCHFTDTNNEILAKLINESLAPGIFFCGYVAIR